MFPLSFYDDKSTKDIDESKWQNNGYNDKLVQQVFQNEQVGGIWFLGGDQKLILDGLYKDKKTSPLLKAINLFSLKEMVSLQEPVQGL